MRFSYSCILLSAWSVLTPAAYTTGVRTTTNQLERIHVVGLSVPGAPASVTAFVNVAVVPMDKETVLSGQTVLVEGERITAIGPASKIRVPAGAVRIDGRGKFLLPGLADMHAHLFHGPHLSTDPLVMAPEADSASAEARLFLWLANGVTTVRNMDYYSKEDGRQALRLRALAATGQSWIPRIYTAGMWGPRVYIGLGHSSKPLGLDTIAALVTAYKAAGYDFIKVHEESPEVLDSVLAVAKRIGIPVAGHVSPPSRVEHILPGYKSIEHPFTDYLWGNRTVLWYTAKKGEVPSDTNGFGVLAAAIRNADVWHCPTQAHYDKWHYDPPKLLKVEQDSGVKLLVGTDELPWMGVITRELQALVSAGLTPYQALLADTRNVAEYFGTLKESGTISTGKRADMVLLTGNPLQDVRYTAQPAGVMLGGRWLSREEINQRVAKLKLPTFTPGEPTPGFGMAASGPVKSYWNNVVDEMVASTGALLHKIALTDTLELETAHQAQQRALIDSLGTSDQYAAGTQRVVRMIAHQLGEDRTEMTPDQLAAFDPKAKMWAQKYKKTEGDAANIPGLP